jgi:hypothetical protein
MEKSYPLRAAPWKGKLSGWMPVVAGSEASARGTVEGASFPAYGGARGARVAEKAGLRDLAASGGLGTQEKAPAKCGGPMQKLLNVTTALLRLKGLRKVFSQRPGYRPDQTRSLWGWTLFGNKPC